MNIKIKKIIIFLLILNFSGALLVFIFKQLSKLSENVNSKDLPLFQQYIILGGILIFASFCINYPVHLFYQRQHRRIMSEIQSKNFIIYKNVDLVQKWNSRFNMGFINNKADLILLDNNQLIVFLYLSNFRGLIKVAQPSILYYREFYDENIKVNVSQKYKIERINYTDTGFIISVNKETIVNSQNLNFDFKLNKNDTETIYESLSSKKY